MIEPRIPQHYSVADTETDPRAIAALEAISYKLNKDYTGRKPLDDATIHDIDRKLVLYVEHIRSKGIKFPTLVAVYMKRSRGVDIVRADLDREEIRKLILRLAAKYARGHVFPTDLSAEIAAGIHRAFPWYKGDDI